MLPAQQSLSIWVGNTTYFTFILQANGSPVDLTGSEIVVWFTWQMSQFRLSSLTGNTGFPMGDTSSIEVEDASGIISIILSPQATRLIADPIIKWELERRIGGNQESHLYGSVKISRWINDDN